MANNENITEEHQASRRRFVYGLVAASVMTAIAARFRIPFFRKSNAIACEPHANKRMIKMLTEEGKLVEIEESLLTKNRRKITDAELQKWIKYK